MTTSSTRRARASSATAVALIAVLIGSTPAAWAQSAPSPVPGGVRSDRAAVGVAIGTGAGFGIGLWAGLAAFDDALYSDRKVWTTAILSGVAGGVVGYLIGRAASSRSRPVSRQREVSGPIPVDVLPGVNVDLPDRGRGTRADRPRTISRGFRDLFRPGGTGVPATSLPAGSFAPTRAHPQG